MSISVIILTHNEEKMLPACLESVKWADEILVVDKKSTDKTLEIAQKNKCKIVKFDGEHFDEWRNLGLAKATSEWILYIDPDERVTKDLEHEISEAISGSWLDTSATNDFLSETSSTSGEISTVSSRAGSKAHLDPVSNSNSDKLTATTKTYAAYKFSRKNIWWGREFTACGASPDYVTRLFQKKKLKKWFGIIHESPEVKGEIGQLNSKLLHFTHRDLISGLKKSYQWTRMEAELFHKAGHPPITWWRLAKVTLSAFFKKYIAEKGYTHGTEGFIESSVQAWNRFMVYEQLWEMQQRKSLENKYSESRIE